MKIRTNGILVFTPQNKEGEKILNQSLYFQQALKKRIFIMNILKSKSVLPLIFQSKKTLHCQKEAIEKLNSFIKNTIQKDIPKDVILRIRWGKIISTLIKESIKGGYEFIIVDKSEGHYDGVLSKKNINKFISKSHCPILTINKEFPVSKINKIVIPLDISQTTQKSLYWVTLFAKKFNAKVQIISTLNINMDETKSLAFNNGEKINAMLIERGIESEMKILKMHNQERHKVILDYINKENPELVIIRTHLECIFSGNKIGKFVSEIIHGCNVPVFTVGDSTENHPVDLK